MKASDLFVKALESEQVEYIFGIPGEENLDLLNSLKGSSIRLILTRHEQAAGFMAATYGRLTGKTGICMATLGPGATNLVTAAAYAQLGAMPMLMITGQKPIKASRQGEFQIVDVVDMMRPLTKYTRQIASAHNGVMMNSQEMETAVRLQLDLVVLILRDDAYGMIKWKQASMGFDDFCLDYGNPDFVQYAHSYGAQGHRVASADALLPLLEQCLRSPGVHLVEAPMDYRDNDRILNREIKQKSRALQVETT
jgi:thiamine pyrophosphate-dependent acetolactate synthase large subunit-like protein